MASTQTTGRAKPYVILASLSFDETGEWALTEAARIAELRPDSELHVVHVVAEDGPAESTGELLALDRRLSRAPEQIKKHIEAVWAVAPRKVVAHLRAGSPSRSIVQAAVDIGADLVVVGSHRRGGLERLLLGSVAERVVRHAHCPVLIALPKNYAGEARSESIEPPCPDCVATRQDTKGETFWCERHARAHLAPHVYEPSDQRRNSLMPTQ